ncbi:MAG TPA: TMEM165/GDT1 family protein [Thermoanaerobaculia bacterium]|nr:TMEM165/GDT1 family protein [Thermoanaerobaculia bacterium]
MSLFLAAFVTILLAEVAGDKLVYAIASLSTRYSIRAVMLGVAPALMIKMAIAVLLGGFLQELPRTLITIVTALTFAIMAVRLLLQTHDEPSAPTKRGSPILSSFATVFSAEWADPAQLAAAALVARFHQPALVWCAGMLALTLKATLACAFGITIARRIPAHALQYGSAALFVVLAVVSLV